MPTIEELAAEVAQLNKKLNKLTKFIAKSAFTDVPDKWSSKTTKQERQNLHEHIEQLERFLSSKKNAKEKPKLNILKIKDIVRCIKFDKDRIKGIIHYIACKDALPSVKKCDKTTCAHDNKNYIWVMWPNKKLFVYRYNELIIMTEDDLKPKVGRELSGKIGPWEYNVETKIWKKDGDDKEYSNDEFEDICYFELNPRAKDDGKKFVSDLMREKSILDEVHKIIESA